MQFVKNLQTSWKIIKKPNFFPLAIVIFFGILAGKGLIGSGYFNMHDDLQIMRQFELEKCFLDGQIPCRWVPDMGYGFGFPLFNFYPPLPYLIGQGIRVLGYSFITTIKLLFIISFVASGVSMYFLSREFFGRFGGIVSSIFYIWAPYHAVDVYVRGAMNESWAFMWFPLILWTSYKLIVKKENQWAWIIGLALSWFALFTSHNLMVLIFTPFFAVWCGIWLISSKNYKHIPQLIISGLWALGLSAFFTLPVLLEKGIVATDTLVVGYYEYTAHFANISQLLFSRFWGYGPSVWLTEGDRMSFQIGWIHWGLSLFIAILLAARYLKTKKIDQLFLVMAFVLATGWFTAFMAHSRSTPIWQLFHPQLKFVQFPWRFVAIVIFSFSFAAGSLVKLLPKLIARVLSLILLLAVLIYSWNYFLPEHGRLGPLTDEEKLSGVAWDMQQTAGIYDYLPAAARTAPKEPRKTVIDIVEGKGEIPSSFLGTNWAKAVVYMESSGTVRLNIIDFPNWKISVNGIETTHFVPDEEEWGRMYIKLPAGRSEIEARLHDTWPRTAGNMISLFSWIFLAAFAVHKERKACSKK